MTLGEIAKGVATHLRRDRAQAVALQRWLEGTRVIYSDRIVPIDAEIAETWGTLAAKRPLPIIDGLLAATALVRRMTFVTRDVAATGDTGVAAINPWET